MAAQAASPLRLKDINKLIVQILKAEKKQREDRQRAETITRGYDATKLQHLCCNINTDLEGSVEAEAMVLRPYQRSQYLDEFTNNLTADVHKYLQEASWRRWVPGIKKSGTTWIELLARFDLLGYRSQGATQKKNKQASGKDFAFKANSNVFQSFPTRTKYSRRKPSFHFQKKVRQVKSVSIVLVHTSSLPAERNPSWNSSGKHWKFESFTWRNPQ